MTHLDLNYILYSMSIETVVIDTYYKTVTIYVLLESGDLYVRLPTRTGVFGLEILFIFTTAGFYTDYKID